MSLQPIPEEDAFLAFDLEDPIRTRKLPRASRSTRSKLKWKLFKRDARPSSRIKMLWSAAQRIFKGILMILGLVTLFTLAWDSFADLTTSNQEDTISPEKRPSLFTNYFTHGVSPVPCHSHNDYWRRVPLYSALTAGCTSVEADIWLENGLLRVGHTRHTVLRGQTLHSLYLNPLLEMLKQHNPHLNESVPVPTSQDEVVGIFAADPTQTLVLLIDFKDGEHLWDYLVEQLRPLRDNGYLSFFNGSEMVSRPVTIVITGDAPFHRVLRNIHRDIFYDAPLDTLEFGISSETAESYSAQNSYYASVDFRKAIGSLPLSRLSQDQLAKLRNQVRAAHERGLKVRYWGTPNWPVSLRNYAWRVLVREGVDILNVDDLRAATRVDWKLTTWW